MKRALLYLLILSALAPTALPVIGQDYKIDSLTTLLGRSNPDTTQISLLIKLGGYYASSNPDKALAHYEQAKQIANNNLNNDVKFNELLITTIRLIGIVYYNQNAFDKAMANFMESLKISEKCNNVPGIIASLNNIGMVHESLHNFDQSIEYYNKSITLSENIGDTFGVARGYNNIGITYANEGKIHLAIANYIKAASAFEKIGNNYYQAVTYNNIGTYYLGLANKTEVSDSTEYYLNQAQLYFEKSLPIFREMKELYDLSTCLVNLSTTHYQLHKIIYKSQSNPSEHLKKAIKYGNESLEMATQIKSFGTIYSAAYTLKDIYKASSNFELATKYADIVISNNDSLFFEDKNRTIADIEAKYQTEKKEQLIEKQQLEASRQKVFRNALIVSLILVILYAISVFIGYRNKTRANSTIKEQNAILEQANAEILAQRDELEAQRDMLVDHNQKMEEAHNHITDSLHYAHSIQAAILPSEKVLGSISPNYFVFMKPYQVVSGDFFWAVSIEEYRIFCVADCTGHGVPGAFMSILGINALNDVVVRHRTVQPNQILGYLRESVTNALGQNDPNQTHKDGMDMALCVFNTKTRELQYSGARIPLWIVTEEFSNFFVLNEKSTKNCITQNGHKLYEIKANIMPVGIAPRMNPFTLNSFSLKGCSANIYLATDGFADQFGGAENGKYGSVKLKKLLLDNIHKPFPKQKVTIQKEFDKWTGTGNQVDDITILGIRL